MWSRGTFRSRLPPQPREFKLGGAGALDGFHREGFIPAEFKHKPNLTPFPRRDSVYTDTEVPSPAASDTRGPTSELEEDSFSILVDAVAGGTPVEVLVDTGATTNLIQLAKFEGLKDKPPLLTYSGRLETADGKYIPVAGRAELPLKLGSIDEKVHVLVLQELKPEMIFGLKSMKRHKCSIDLECDQLWTGSNEGSAIPVRLASPKGLAGFREAVPDPRMIPDIPASGTEAPTIVERVPTQHVCSLTDGSGPEDEDEEYEDCEFVATILTDHLLQLGATPPQSSDREKEVEQILDLCAPGVESDARLKLKDLITEYRDVFALTDEELGTTHVVEHHIDTGDTRPIKLPAHRIAPAKLPIVQEEF